MSVGKQQITKSMMKKFRCTTDVVKPENLQKIYTGIPLHFMNLSDYVPPNSDRLQAENHRHPKAENHSRTLYQSRQKPLKLL